LTFILHAVCVSMWELYQNSPQFRSSIPQKSISKFPLQKFISCIHVISIYTHCYIISLRDIPFIFTHVNEGKKWWSRSKRHFLRLEFYQRIFGWEFKLSFEIYLRNIFFDKVWMWLEWNFSLISFLLWNSNLTLRVVRKLRLKSEFFFFISL
jgi:hypothetical protein